MGVQPHPSGGNCTKALLSKALLTRARPSFSHHHSLPSGGLHKPLSLLHQRADRRSKNHSPTVTKTKTTLQKVNQREKQKAMSQRKEQYKISEKQLSEMEIGNPPEKEFRIMIVKIIQDLGEKMEAKIEIMQKCLPKTQKN